MRSSFRMFANPQATLKRNCVSQVMVTLSTLASTAVVLVQVAPAIFR